MDTTILTNVLFATLTLFLIFVIAGSAIVIVCAVSVLKAMRRAIDNVTGEIEKLEQTIEKAFSFITGIVAIIKNLGKKSKKSKLTN